MSKCDYCVNKSDCDKCDKNWKDRFIPNDKVKPYFSYGYCGVRGINGCTWDFDTTNRSLKSTHHIVIGSTHYCPYCGEIMQPIQDPDTLAIIGHCCICQGAMDELEYEKKKRELFEKHQREILSLQKEYEDKLSFCSEKLLDIKQKQERESMAFFSRTYNHFSMMNGKACDNIDQII